MKLEISIKSKILPVNFESFIDRKFNNMFRVKYYKIHIESFESNIDILLLNVSSQNFEIFVTNFDPVTEKNIQNFEWYNITDIRFGYFWCDSEAWKLRNSGSNFLFIKNWSANLCRSFDVMVKTTNSMSRNGVNSKHPNPG